MSKSITIDTSIAKELFFEKLSQSLSYHSLQTPQSINTYLINEPVYSYRLRTNEENINDIVSSLEVQSTPIQYCKGAFYADTKPHYQDNSYFQDGKLYSQEASSMYYAQVLKYISTLLEESPICLDMCAAPGGKSLLIHDFIPKSVVISNEIDGKRNKTLTHTINSWDSNRCIATQAKAQKWGKIEEFFDLAIVDAPCSGEGMIRKQDKEQFFKEYSQTLIDRCVRRQKEILNQLMPSVKTGGYILYSTCTFNIEENEEIIDFATSHLGLEVVSLADCVNMNHPETPYITTQGFLRFYPHLFKGEGLFIALLKKVDHYSTGQEKEDSLWKKKRTSQYQLVEETRHHITSSLSQYIDTAYTLYKRNIPHSDIIKPQELFAIHRSCVPLLDTLYSHSIKITYPGKTIATVGKNITKTLKMR